MFFNLCTKFKKQLHSTVEGILKTGEAKQSSNFAIE